MPEITIIHIALLALSLIVGLVVGWLFRGQQSDRAQLAINAGWSEQLEAQRAEQERLVDQNRMLMEQNSEFKASNKDSTMRAAELSSALKEAFERRDQLQRQIKDIRGNLESAVRERDRLQSDIAHRDAEVGVTSESLKQRDDQIAQLNKELASWKERVPPLVERFRTRNEEALQLEEELAAAQDRLAALEAMLGSEQTRVEPVDRDALGDDLYASNEPLETVADDEASDDDGHLEQTLDAGDSDTDAAAEDDEPDSTAGAAIDADADEPGSAAIYPFTAAANGRDRDDLKRIKGVGPAIEKTLNEMGIRRFYQIAEMSEYEIDRIARRLKGFRSRIYREDWMGQARDLEQLKTADQH